MKRKASKIYLAILRNRKKPSPKEGNGLSKKIKDVYLVIQLMLPLVGIQQLGLLLLRLLKQVE